MKWCIQRKTAAILLPELLLIDKTPELSLQLTFPQ